MGTTFSLCAQASLRAPWVGAQGGEGPWSRNLRASWSLHTPGEKGAPLVPSLNVGKWGQGRQRDRERALAQSLLTPGP